MVGLYSSEAKQWFERADKCRAVAEGMHDPEAKRVLIDVAARYDNMAADAELKARTANVGASGPAL